jgi:hypothetical protein
MAKVDLGLVSLLVLVAGPAWPAQGPREVRIGAGRTHAADVVGVGQAQIEHHRGRAQRAYAPRPLSGDVGEVAVVVDQGSIVTAPRPDRPFDLPLPTRIDFTPDAMGFAVSASNGPLEPAGGTVLALADDDTVEVGLGFDFVFFGATYRSVFVNSDGNLTLGAGDRESSGRDAARLIDGPPRIAPLMGDFDPSAGGSVSVAAARDRVVVTWSGVPQTGGVDSNTFQATLWAGGAIRFSYAVLETIPFQTMTVGIAPGQALGPFQAVDFSTSLPASLEAGAIFEQFSVSVKRFDLAAQGLTFTPAGGGFAVARAAVEFDPGLGLPLPIAAERAVELPLGFEFIFMGASYSSVFVNADGHLSLGAGDPEPAVRNESSFLGGPPRIAPLFASLFPEEGGMVSADVRNDRVVVTWLEVPSFTGTETFQVTLRSDGAITLAYPGGAGRGIVGVSAGGFPRPVHEVDFSVETPVTLEAGAIFERFGFFRQRLDLIAHSLSFSPAADGFAVASSAGGLDSRIGPPIPLGCPTMGTGPCVLSVELPLGFTFPFNGADYDRIFVNAAGNVTLGRPDETLELRPGDLLEGPPRMAAFGATQITFQGEVHADLRADRGVITWWDQDTCCPSQVFQIVLSHDGGIVFSYNLVPSSYTVVGIAAGSGQGTTSEVDFSADLPATFPPGTIFEEFHPGILYPEVDTLELAQEFYRTHADKYDFLVLFTDFPTGFSFVPMFMSPVSNHTRGIGAPVFDLSGLLGSAGEREGVS